jgi:predicted transcriptional regulator
MIHAMELPQRTLLADRLRHPPPTDQRALLVSIKPHYATLIERGDKRVEFRRRFPSHWPAGPAFFYITSPVRADNLHARIASVTRATTARLWEDFGRLSGVTRREFDAYFAGARTGVALLLEDVRPLGPIPLDDPRLRALGFRPPQSLEVLPASARILHLLNSSATPRPVPDRSSW